MQNLEPFVLNASLVHGSAFAGFADNRDRIVMHRDAVTEMPAERDRYSNARDYINRNLLPYFEKCGVKGDLSSTVEGSTQLDHVLLHQA